MELEQAFSATRRDCGRHVESQSTLPEVVGEIRSSLQYDSGHIYQKTGVLEVDTTSSLSVTIVGTRTKQSVSRGMTHSEGGWPREVDPEASTDSGAECCETTTFYLQWKQRRRNWTTA